MLCSNSINMTQKQWSSDLELFEMIKRNLFTAVVGDVLDKAGLYHQFLPPHIRSLRKDMVVIGRAMPVLEADVYMEVSLSGSSTMQKPFGLMLEALDDLKHHEVYICTGGSPRYALWGELMSTRAIKLGASGAVLNGYVRDTRGIFNLNFPTFAMGSYAQDQGPRGKVIDFRVPIEIEHVKIMPGDIIFGDMDGVLVIPQRYEAEIIQAALEKASGEQLVKQAIESGMSACEAFETYGIM